MKIIWLALVLVLVPIHAHAAFKVVTTTTTLQSLVSTVGGTQVEVNSIAKAGQDPHYVEAKPSYMIKIRDANLVVFNGLDLEVGWFSNVLRGARSPDLLDPQKGLLEAGRFVTAIEVPHGSVDRAEGDIHPMGNPHFLLDSERALAVVDAIAERLGKLDPPNQAVYRSRADAFSKELRARIVTWKSRVAATGIQKVITYHKTLNYFLASMGISLAASIEPKPGIPPTARHYLDLMAIVKVGDVPCILVESFFELNTAERIQKEAPVVVAQVATEVGALPGADSYTDMIEKLVLALEACHGAHK